MKKTEAMVLDVLQRFPQTRNSDDLLYMQVCMEIDSHGAGMPFWYVLQHRTEFGFPAYKSVERYRRMMQKKFPELAANKEIEDFRAEKEQEFREYARG